MYKPTRNSAEKTTLMGGDTNHPHRPVDGVASLERPARKAGRAPALGNTAKNDFAIKFSDVQERRNSRYDLRNRARELAKKVPALCAQKRMRERREARAESQEEARQAVAQRRGELFALPRTPREKIEVFRSHRMTYCGASVLSNTETVLFREGIEDARAGITGLQTCGSYACPTCAPKIGQRRYEEVVQVLQSAKNGGQAVAMVTLTVRHSKEHALEHLWDGISEGWREITTSVDYTGESPEYYEKVRADYYERGRAYDDLAHYIDQSTGHLGTRAEQDAVARAIRAQYPDVRAPRGWKYRQAFRPRRVGFKETYGIAGMMRSTEVTVGKAGFHPHVHALVVFKAGADVEETAYRAEKIGEFMHEKWSKGLAKHGLESWRDFGGLDVSVMESTAEDIARYATKASRLSGLEIDPATRKMGLESARGDLKTGREDPDGNRSYSPMELLELAVSGDDWARRHWLAFATASQGRRWLVIPAELRELAQLDAEQTDEEIAAETYEGLAVAAVPAAEWRKARLWLHSACLLTVLEDSGARAFFDALTALGVAYEDLRCSFEKNFEEFSGDECARFA